MNAVERKSEFCDSTSRILESGGRGGNESCGKLEGLLKNQEAS